MKVRHIVKVGIKCAYSATCICICSRNESVQKQNLNQSRKKKKTKPKFAIKSPFFKLNRNASSYP